MRLGFSIAIYTDAPILLIDEVLAVGDEEFQKKCLSKLEQLRKELNTTIVFVSHDQKSVEKFCDRVILLHLGELIFSGSPTSAFIKYHKLIAKDSNNAP
jgi:ABC-type polysaccharide/polyol phosphate transport system ATPase subunit